MAPEDLLRNIKDDLEFCLRAEAELVQKSMARAENRQVSATLQQTIKKIDAQLANPDVQPQCGLYLFDGTRQYGYTFAQLQHLLEEYQNTESVFYKKDWGLSALLKWLHEVSRTSIGDLHGDMLKHVVVTYHRPTDFSDEELEERYKTFDKFWEDVVANQPKR